MANENQNGYVYLKKYQHLDRAAGYSVVNDKTWPIRFKY